MPRYRQPNKPPSAPNDFNATLNRIKKKRTQKRRARLLRFCKLLVPATSQLPFLESGLADGSPVTRGVGGTAKVIDGVSSAAIEGMRVSSSEADMSAPDKTEDMSHVGQNSTNCVCSRFSSRIDHVLQYYVPVLTAIGTFILKSTDILERVLSNVRNMYIHQC